MLRTIVIVTLLLGYGGELLAAGERFVPVTVAMRHEVTVGDRLAKTGDVAEIQGGDVAMRRRIATLDIAEREEAQIGTITKSQIALRLRLAGISADRFQITGPELAVIRWDATEAKQRDGEVPREAIEHETTTGHANAIVIGTTPDDQSADRRILNAAEKSLTDAWKVPLADIDVRLSRPVSSDTRKLLDSDPALTLEPFMPASVTPGEMHLSFGAYRDATLVQRFAVVIESRVQRQVAVAMRDIGAREVLTASDVRLESQFTDGRVATQAATEVVGKSSTHSIRQGAVLLTTDVRDAPTNEPTQTTIIKRGDLVRIIARGNGLTVSMRTCEALENGYAGQMIRVRNLNSKKTVAGRVLPTGEIEIRL